MSLIGVVREEVRRALSKFELIAEIVTAVVVDGTGRASGKGAGDQDVDADVGGMFGFYGYAPDGATGISIKLGGKRASAILTVLRHTKYEPSLNKGECAMQNAFGAKELLDKNGSIQQLPAAGQKVYAGAAPGSTQPAVLGNALEARLAALEAAYVAHVHPGGPAGLTAPANGGPVTGSTLVTTSTVTSPGANIKAANVELA